MVEFLLVLLTCLFFFAGELKADYAIGYSEDEYSIYRRESLVEEGYCFTLATIANGQDIKTLIVTDITSVPRETYWYWKYTPVLSPRVIGCRLDRVGSRKGAESSSRCRNQFRSAKLHGAVSQVRHQSAASWHYGHRE